MIERPFKGGTLVNFFTVNNAEKAISGTLAQEQAMIIQGNRSAGNFLKFAAAPVVLNKAGQVITGILAEDQSWMVPANQNMVSFKAGTAIAFNSEGRVVKGTWAQDTVWRTENASPIPHIFFQAGTPATFNAQGTVVTGTLARETFLFNTAGIQKLYPKGSFVTFNSKGQVQ